MLKGKQGIVFCIILTVALAFSAVQAMSASAYLHVANAQNYARAHAWRTICNYNCYLYPQATGWYQRINNNYVRVEIKIRKGGCDPGYRVFAVRGNDGSEYITTEGSGAYWLCY